MIAGTTVLVICKYACQCRPNTNLYAQLKRDALDRVSQITMVEYVPDDIEATELRATFDPNRLDPLSGPDSPELTLLSAPVKYR
ncbi:hypothetical protein Harman_33000 [Haloarcula mannanilytica]|uniref:Uncharacterized protein n=1 Tax=Haloarcula mannanilytica TaxID=2509225 RepID=A0A4C2ELU8_9EURY|nr:hypothetical protein Harman_33000 [Haloarcula mannanilytica]